MKTSKDVNTVVVGPVNEVDSIPKNYQLFKGDDSYQQGDLIAYKSDKEGNVISWLKVGESSVLIKKHMKIIKEVPVWRKN